MSKKYIQNCTGDNCSLEDGPRKRDLISGKFRRVVFYFLAIMFIAELVYVVFFSPYLEVSKITVNGTQELDSLQLQQKLQDSLGGKFFGVIPKNNFLFISQNRIANLLMNDFKKIRSVSVSKKFPDSLDVTIDERKALMVWCSGEACFLIDENGYAYSQADFNSPQLMQNHLLQINEQGGQSVVMGEKVIEQAYEQYALSIKDALARAGFEVTDQYSTPSRMANEIDVKTSQGPEFYFSTEFSLDSAMRTLDTIFKKEITADKKNDLTYVDMRNESKIFYKFNNQQSNDQAIGQTASENAPATNADVKKGNKKK